MKQHMITDNDKTLCGYECSVQELWWQRKNKWRHVNCKRCYQLRHRVVEQEDEE